MKRLFALGNRYLEKSDWKDLALVKFCLCAMGVMLGAAVPEKGKKPVSMLAAVVFLATYIPLMTKLWHVAKEMFHPAQSENQE